jgi:hypothetical protein
LGCLPRKRTTWTGFSAFSFPITERCARFAGGAGFLTQFAVDIRYPGENASKRQAEAALRWADKVRTAARVILGLRPSRRRRP